MRFKLALFDFDGTLADSALWFLNELNQMADELKLRRIEETDFEKLRGYSSKQVMEYLRLSKWKLPILMNRMRSAAARDNSHITLFPGVDSMLAELHSRAIVLGIVSSNAEANIRRILGPENSARIRHFSCGASLFGKATKLRGALRRARISPADSIYIGDEIRDAVACREVGISFGAVSWGYTTLDALHKEAPAFEFQTVKSICDALQYRLLNSSTPENNQLGQKSGNLLIDRIRGKV
jgi:phosphoglycolate phosphatase